LRETPAAGATRPQSRQTTMLPATVPATP
jgi:hypothetical protein